MNNDFDTFDGFDQALLTELRQVAAENTPAPVRRTRRRWALSGAGLAAAAVTAFGVTTLGSSAAYAVDENSNGDVTITIHELSDADGLEKALADHGIEADVDYQADGGPGGPVISQIDPEDLPQGIEPGDSGVVEGEGQFEAHAESGTAGEQPAGADVCGGFEDMPFTSDLKGDEFVITIPKDSVLRDSDAELKITTSGDLKDNVAGLQVAYSVGDVDCGFGSMTARTVTPANEG
ncbi:hypothetical protein F0U44_05065 [Nocardioides humilatus]|uniref:Uncharacterized protein n=2 Tax=Nocardioides humilatus TaxID=2607660 RepID=A0A5B1LPR5_9ACTN|nr:hypothetical protein F0U44_05065 [Nocardioides humilatus]